MRATTRKRTMPASTVSIDSMKRQFSPLLLRQLLHLVTSGLHSPCYAVDSTEYPLIRLLLSQGRHAGQRLAGEELKRRTSASRDMADPGRDSCLDHCSY